MERMNMTMDFLTLLLLIAIPVSLLAGVILRIAKKRTAGNILLFLFALAMLAIFASVPIPDLLQAHGVTWLTPAWYAVPFFAVGTFGVAFCLFPRIRIRWKALTAVLICAAVTGSFFGIKAMQKRYDAVERVDTPNDLLERYLPYAEGTETASLSEESTLRLTEDLPVLDGATALFPVYSAFAKAVYPKEALDRLAPWGLSVEDNPILHCSTTTGAYEKIVSGEADIIFVGAPSDAQRAAARDAGVELTYTPIGREGFVFFVNAKNPIENLEQETIREIYGGKLRRWSELGVKGLGRIIPFQREEGSGSQSALLRMMDGSPLMEAPKENVFYDMAGIVSVTGNYKNFKNALGYSFRFYCKEMVKNDGIKLLKIDGVAPTAETISDGTYPLGESFFAVTRTDAGETVQAFLQWITGEQGQELVEKTGYARSKAADEEQ